MTHRSISYIPASLALSAGLGLCVPGAQAASPFDGTTAATAGLSARQILRDNPMSPSGVYWIDPDGPGGVAPVQRYADMTTAGGGWILVRRSAGTGGWINLVDNLAGTASLNPAEATKPLSSLDWTVPFNASGADFLFATGNGAAWGVLASADVFKFNSNFAPNVTVKASNGVAVAAGGMTNVLNRFRTNGDGGEDPWVGFQGDHFANIPRMLYGEAGFGGAHATFKNANQGANVFVRELVAPTLPVPEPGTWALWLAGLVGLLGMARHRRLS